MIDVRRDGKGNVKVVATGDDTYDWAHKPGGAWPCSVLSGKGFCAGFQGGDLVELTMYGHRDVDVPIDEFNAFIEDATGSVNPQ